MRVYEITKLKWHDEQDIYDAQYARLQRGHKAGTRFVSELLTKASRLGFLQLTEAHRWSLSRAGCGVAVRLIGQAWSSGRKCFLQYCLSQRHRIGRRSNSLHELKEQWAPMRGRSMVDATKKEMSAVSGPIRTTRASNCGVMV